MTEENVLKFMRDSVNVPTRGKKFLEAAVLAGHLFGLGIEAAVTARSRGVAIVGLKRKGPTKKRLPLPAGFVQELEGRVAVAYKNFKKLGDEERAMAIFRGFVLWVTHTRTRFGDSAKIAGEPVLDLDSDDTGYIEASAEWGSHKTGYSLRKAGKSLPLVAIAEGLTGMPWAKAWLAMRVLEGLHAKADGTLMPEILADWTLGQSRMKTEAGAELLRRDLELYGCRNTEDYGTHSCKATALSWCAKAGVSHDDRRILGGHSDPKDGSMLEYSRDALAGPLRVLRNLYKKVQDGEFAPDVTRSGRWAKAKAAIGDEDKQSDKDKDTKIAEEMQEKDKGSEEKEQGMSSGVASTAESEEEVEEFDGDQKAETGSGKSCGVWLNVKQRKVHQPGADGCTTACGNILTIPNWEFAQEMPDGEWKLCGRSKCFG